jgi:hypothetical protein
MNESESTFDHEQEFINYLRKKRGPCPDDDTLIAFYERTLSPDQAERIQAHVHLCGTCQVAMEMLERYDQCQAEELPLPPDWPEIERRSRERFYAFLKSQKVSSPARVSFWERLRGVFLQLVRNVVWHPALAYLLVLALAYPAYRGLFRKPEVVTKVVPQKEIVEVEKPALGIEAVTDFVELKSPERAASAGPSIVRLRPDKPSFALSFSVPISERPEFVYDVEVRDSQGRVVAAEKAAQPRDELGNFLFVCRRELFSPGRYELQVKEVNKTTQAVTRTFSFLFTVKKGHG